MTTLTALLSLIGIGIFVIILSGGLALFWIYISNYWNKNGH